MIGKISVYGTKLEPVQPGENAIIVGKCITGSVSWELLQLKEQSVEMVPILYMFPPSPPVRSVLLCTKALGLNLEIKTVNLSNGEHLAPEFVQINPQHTIPTLQDDRFIVWDSHAIMGYLVGKYSTSKSLYPNNPKKRAIIDQRLHFDSNFLFPRGEAILKSILYGGCAVVQEDKKESLLEAYDLTETFLENRKYIAGEELSIADFSFVTSLNSFSAFVPIDKVKYPRITVWMKTMEKLSYYDEANKTGMEMFREMVSSKLSQ